MATKDQNEKVITAIEVAIKGCGVHAIAQLPTFQQAIQMAHGIAALREALTDEFVKLAIMPLQGTALGFCTDKDKEGGYPLSVVKDVAIEAMLRGFQIVGNEFNIIGGRFYGTKAGFERHVQQYPGLTDLVLQPGVPQLSQDKSGALVPFLASWRLDGNPMSIACEYRKEGEHVTDHRIPVRVNAGMGADAVIGKATRKMLFRVYQRLNGSAYGAGEGDITDSIETTGEAVPQIAAPSPVPPGTPEGQRVKLPGKNGRVQAASEPTAPPEWGNVDLPGAS